MIRPIHPGDAGAAATLIRNAFASVSHLLDPQPSALRETGPSIAVHLQTGGGAVDDRGTVVGCVLWSERDGGLYVHRLAVDAAHRGQGVASGLLDAAEAEARRRGLPRLHLAVRLALEGNRRLFAAAGFVETRLRTHEGYAAPTFVEAEKWLARPIPAPAP